MAQALVDRGLRKDDVVMVQLPNVWELAMLYLAVARAGGVIAPIPVQWRAKEFSYIAGLTEAAMFITTRQFRGFSGLDMARQLQGQLPALREILTLEDIREMARGAYDEERLGAIPMDANDIFTICWTSGTEAEPKGCPLSHNNWLFQARMLSKATGFGPHQTQLCVAPLVNMTAVGVNFIPWLTFGGTFVLHHPFDAEIFIGQMVQEQVNFTILVPAVINMIAKHPNVDQFDLRAVRTITTGSAPPSLWAMQEFKRRWGIEIVNIWGQNEGTGLVAGPVDVPDVARRADRFPDWGKSCVDWVVQGVRTKLVDPVTKEVLTEVGAVGELAYRGPNVMAGYYRRPDLTAKAFDEDGYFYTGDLFQRKEENFIGFFDRKKDIIIRGGFNISAQEVENTLLGHPKVADVAAVAMPDPVLGERTCVYVVPRAPGDPPTLEELVEFMKSRGVAVYKWPERLELIEAIPRNPVGKILKKELREDLRAKMGAGEESPSVPLPGTEG
ncbi:class I adenylate-forming enzyme family protein [Kyrpidia spormannii]|uniref:2,3-dihydroxybenzoate-AMP ligase n=1 Tax=Kyrpidia spormannii TaxID=2055160 RepID=A0A6F9E553_9BACL|nr:class I adenylate-forming enzyme family protein [Kyrpidia spormannii]CAB3391555.1 2,3-dihydroxybenzoate-AMP ligase [Kyrpidia spormannii]